MIPGMALNQFPPDESESRHTISIGIQFMDSIETRSMSKLIWSIEAKLKSLPAQYSWISKNPFRNFIGIRLIYYYLLFARFL